MLYTTMPWEAIFPNDCSSPASLTLARVYGRPCLVRKEVDGTTRIERLLSTDPADFLDDRFAPNTTLDWWF